jgi:DnaJ-class molecular chaperone
MTPLCPYKFLNIPRNSTQAQIKLAYYKLAKQLHPDTTTGDVHKFKLLSQCYKLLSTKESRKLYDSIQFGATNNSQKYSGNGFTSTYTSSFKRRHFYDYDRGFAKDKNTGPIYMANGKMYVLILSFAFGSYLCTILTVGKSKQADDFIIDLQKQAKLNRKN